MLQGSAGYPVSSNLHTHCCFCDGKGTPEEFIGRALELGFTDLGFSSHAPVPFRSAWNMREGLTDAYLGCMEGLKNKWSGRLRIYAGLEIDYLSGEDRTVYGEERLDYSIGAVHFVRDPASGRYYGIDGSAEKFEEALKLCAGGDIRRLAEIYYGSAVSMLQKQRRDILAHLDIIKKNNRGGLYFKESDGWYRALVLGLLEEARRRGVKVEVNTGGIARGKTDAIYPSDWILRECIRLDIPLVLSSDAHEPCDLDFYFRETAAFLRLAGCRGLWEYLGGRWTLTGL